MPASACRAANRSVRRDSIRAAGTPKLLAATATGRVQIETLALSAQANTAAETMTTPQRPNPPAATTGTTMLEPIIGCSPACPSTSSATTSAASSAGPEMMSGVIRDPSARTKGRAAIAAPSRVAPTTISSSSARRAKLDTVRRATPPAAEGPRLAA
jgi:hypothetical protein